MLSEDQTRKLDELQVKYDILRKDFPTWEPSPRSIDSFPADKDLKNIAFNINILNQELRWGEAKSSPKKIVKFVLLKTLQPVLRLMFRRQYLINEYIWLMANTIATQNKRISALEKELNEGK